MVKDERTLAHTYRRNPGMPSTGHRMPDSSMTGKNEPVEYWTHSCSSAQMDERKRP